MNGLHVEHEMGSCRDAIHALESEPPRVVGPNILVCEDSVVARIWVKRALQGIYPAAKIFEAADGKTGFDVLKNQRVDLVVTDLQMEGMDGENFLRLLKRNALLGKKPVLVLSGAISSELKQEYASRPEVQFLAKPASTDQFQGTIGGLMKATKWAATLGDEGV